MALHQRGATAAVGLALLSGCAPVMTNPPPVPMASEQEHYAAATFAQVVNEHLIEWDDSRDYQLVAGTTIALGDWQGGLQVYGGHTAWASWVGSPVEGGGGLYALRLHDVGQRVQLGYGASAGLLYGQASAPMNLRLGSRTWVYATPSLGWNFVGELSARADLGLNHQLPNGHSFYAQAGLTEMRWEHGLLRPHRLTLAIGMELGR